MFWKAAAREARTQTLAPSDRICIQIISREYSLRLGPDLQGVSLSLQYTLARTQTLAPSDRVCKAGGWG